MLQTRYTYLLLARYHLHLSRIHVSLSHTCLSRRYAFVSITLSITITTAPSNTRITCIEDDVVYLYQTHWPRTCYATPLEERVNMPLIRTELICNAAEQPMRRMLAVKITWAHLRHACTAPKPWSFLPTNVRKHRCPNLSLLNFLYCTCLMFCRSFRSVLQLLTPFFSFNGRHEHDVM